MKCLIATIIELLIDWVTEGQTDCCFISWVSFNSLSLWWNSFSDKQYFIQNSQHAPACQRATPNTVQAAHL